MTTERAAGVPTRDDHSLLVLTDVEKVMTRASADPGRYVGRGDDYDEPLYQWQARAILVALLALSVEQRMGAMGMEPNIIEFGNQGWPNHRYVTCWVPAGTSRAGDMGTADQPANVSVGPVEDA